MATQAVPPQTGTPTGNPGTKKRIRKVFGNIHEVVQMPNLIEVQRESYEQFLRSDPYPRFRRHRRARFRQLRA
jgi:DNA-directed RNA polymerase subunit beta